MFCHRSGMCPLWCSIEDDNLLCVCVCVCVLLLLMSFYRDGFGIKWPTKVDMPLNKETETDYYLCTLYI